MSKEQLSTLKLHAKRLRRDETEAERKLWMRLRDRQVNGFKFRRKQTIGRYIVDFFCPEQRLVIELDGGHHTLQRETDQRRTDFLTKADFRVLRFWDNEVLANTEAVLQQIADELKPPHPTLSLQGRGYRKDNPLPQGAREKKRAPSSRPSTSRDEGINRAGRKSPLTLALSLKGRGDHGGKR
ncbi:MAG: DUF559 domain-containing protein [Nitrospirae bacterium]|nr:MAG: DUF559 domain-containing protein [Nitrospirota bacterium]